MKVESHPHTCFNVAISIQRIVPRCTAVVVTSENSPIEHFILHLLCPHGNEHRHLAYIGTPDFDWVLKHCQQPQGAHEPWQPISLL